MNRRWLANLGAVITIAALAVDPFSQQIIQFQPCLWNATGLAAQIPKAQTFQPGITTPSVKPRMTGSMQAAIYMGLLSPPLNSSATVTASCQTGNCTFPSDRGATFSTLAMCQSCVDISDTITYNTSDIPRQRPASIPSGAETDGLYTMFSSMTDSTSFPDSVFSFEALMSRVDDDNNVSDFAVACGMDPCVKTFAANVTDNAYQETELSSSATLVWSYHAGYTLAANTTLRNGTWADCQPTAQNTSTNTLRINTTTMGLISHIAYGSENPVSSNIDVRNISAGASLWYPEDCVWWYGTVPADATATYLSDFFNNKTLDPPYWSRDPSSAQGDLWLVNLYRNGTADMGTVGAYMDGLAWSMTADMRKNSGDGSELRAAAGQALALESCLRVRWAWLGLPASLLGLEVAFLVAMVAFSRSKRHWRGDWKGSSLALLFHGLGDDPAGRREKKAGDTAPERHDLGDKAGMFKAAEQMRVQLRGGDGSWQFCRAE